jgi:hypothetical protein
MSGGDGPISFAAADTMHPFAFALSVRAQSDGVVAGVEGARLNASTEMKTIERGNRPAAQIEVTTLSAAERFTSTVSVRGGLWVYTASTGSIVASTVKADTAWHIFVISHYAARGETLFFVDGRLAGRTTERLEPKHFVVGGPWIGAGGSGPKQVDLKDLMIYRSALNADEVSAMQNGTLLQSSLEVYAPLADASLKVGTALENRAQSLTFAKVDGGGLMHVDK